MDAQFRDCDEALEYWEARVDCDHGGRVLARLQARAFIEHMDCEQAVDLLKHADVFVAVDEAEPAGVGLSITELLATHPGLDVTAEDIAEYLEELRRQRDEHE